MNRQEIVDLFIEVSGRQDYRDNPRMMQFLLDSAVSFLDNRAEWPQGLTQHTLSVGVGSYFVWIRDCVAVHAAYIVRDGSKTKLAKKPLDELREHYPVIMEGLSENLSPSATMRATTTGTPMYYCPLRIRQSHQQSPIYKILPDKWGPREGIEGALPAALVQYNGVMFLPGADEEMSLCVVGVFKTPKLIHDIDINYWSVNYPNILIQAMSYQLEVFYSNTQGQQDKLYALDQELMGIVATQIVSEEAAEATLENR